MKQYEKQLETARANSKAEKERKEKEAKEAKEHKEIYERHLKKADEQTAEGKYADALINLCQARLHCQTRIELLYKSVKFEINGDFPDIIYTQSTFYYFSLL